MLFTPKPLCWEGRAVEFRSLHLSLNAPVIAIDDLPVGPARAGIALCVEPAGTLRLEIAIRSLRTGQVIAFAPGSRPADEEAAARVLEASFSFAEGMGFLFDDEETAPRTGADLANAWRDFVGAAPVRRSGAEAPVLDLIHEIPVQESPAASTALVVEVDSPSPAVAAAGTASRSVLSKHRLALAGVTSKGSAGGGSETVVAAVQAASIRDHDTRIRLLSRF
jgi:hypothetical protein